MRAILVGTALAIFGVTPSLADFYIVQEPTTKRCRIVEERPAPGVGVVIGGLSFGVRTEAESRMRTIEEAGHDVDDGHCLRGYLINVLRCNLGLDQELVAGRDDLHDCLAFGDYPSDRMNRELMHDTCLRSADVDALEFIFGSVFRSLS